MSVSLAISSDNSCRPESHKTGIFLLGTKVNCTVVQALRFCTGCTVRRGSRGIGKGKVHHCTGTEALYRLYGP